MNGFETLKPLLQCLLPAIVAVILLFPAFSFSADITVRIEDQKLSISATQVPLQEILKHLTAFGVNVRIDPEINPAISVSFRDRDLASGLQSILRNLNHVLVWEARLEGNAADGRLVEIQIFRPGKKERMAPLESRRILSVARAPFTGALYVMNEVLILPAPGVGPEQIEAAVRAAGAEIRHMVELGGIYHVVLPEGTDIHVLVQRLREDTRLSRVEPNYAYPATPPSRLTMESDISPRHQAFDVRRISGPHVAVLDSGVAQNTALENIVIAGMDALDPANEIGDNLGHGTQMALIASGAVTPIGAPSVEDDVSPVIAVRIFDDNGFTSNFAALRALAFAMEQGAAVISMSWGSETESLFLSQACRDAAAKGVILVAAAGNEPTGMPVYPAAFESVLGVGALDADGDTWSGSNFGSFVPVYAPGVAILPVGYLGDPGLYAGTSIATAYVARRLAAAARLHPGATAAQLMEIISQP